MIKDYWSNEELDDLKKWLTKRFGFKKWTDNHISIFAESLTHVSISREINYERLEFLGDRVLGLVISEYLFKNKKNLEVGDLHDAHVSFTEASMLAKLYFDLELNKKLKLVTNTDIGEKKKGDIFEAFIAAVFSLYGLNAVRKIFNEYVFKACKENNSFVAINENEELFWKRFKKAKYKKSKIKMTRNSDSIWTAELELGQNSKCTFTARKVTEARSGVIKSGLALLDNGFRK